MKNTNKSAWILIPIALAAIIGLMTACDDNKEDTYTVYDGSKNDLLLVGIFGQSIPTLATEITFSNSSRVDCILLFSSSEKQTGVSYSDLRTRVDSLPITAAQKNEVLDKINSSGRVVVGIYKDLLNTRVIAAFRD
jgi:hypothetical protein